MTIGLSSLGLVGPSADPHRVPRRWGTSAALVTYLLLAVFLWWGVWGQHPTTTTTCGCGDAARFIWFFEWPAYALTHGHSVLYSQWLFHPTGINLLNDTSVLALGVPLVPLTLVAGPVASMNVALTLAPAASAFTMFVLVRRWVAWVPAAFIGGLAYGFSPFVVTELALNQLNLAFLAVVPLLVLVLDELLVRQRGSPYRTGAALAALLVVQFFLSTEVLVISCLFAVVGVALLLGFAWLTGPEGIGRRMGHALRGSATGVGAAAAVLAYPAWFLLRGPAHLTGPIWSNGSISQFGNTLGSFWSTGGLARLQQEMLRFGGYQGRTLPVLGYLGPGVIVVALVGAIVWHRDHRLLFFGALGLVAALVSLRPGRGYWVPWQALRHLPWVGDVVEVRFAIVVVLCTSVMVAVVIDRARLGLARWQPMGRYRTPAAIVLASAMLLPTAIALRSAVPLTTRAVVLPAWYAEVGASLPPGNVLLSYPVPFSGLQSSQAWQAVNRMRYAEAGGGGPEGQAARAGRARSGFEVLMAASFAVGAAPGPTAANLAAVRAALSDWGVTIIVVPDQARLPQDEQGRSTAYALALLTAAMGRPPVYDRGAWLWHAVRAKGPPVVMTAAAFDACVSLEPAAVPSCVLAPAG